MALKQTFEINGMLIIDGYIKVEHSVVQKDNMTALVTWRPKTDAPVLKQMNYVLPYVLEGANPLAQAYGGIKSLTEFADATDC